MIKGVVHPISQNRVIVILNYHTLNQIELAFTCVYSLKFTNMPINNTIPPGVKKHPGYQMSPELMFEQRMALFIYLLYNALQNSNFH